MAQTAQSGQSADAGTGSNAGLPSSPQVPAATQQTPGAQDRAVQGQAVAALLAAATPEVEAAAPNQDPSESMARAMAEGLRQGQEGADQSLGSLSSVSTTGASTTGASTTGAADATGGANVSQRGAAAQPSPPPVPTLAEVAARYGDMKALLAQPFIGQGTDQRF